MKPSETTTSTSSMGVRIVGGKRCRVTCNNITGFRRNGIMLDGYDGRLSCDYNIVDGNIVWDNGKDTEAAIDLRSGIYVRSDSIGNAANNTLTNNVVYDTAGVSGTQTYGLAVKNATYLYVSGNRLAGNARGTVLHQTGNSVYAEAT